ncbi:histidinol-phosphatase HisJ family protein [Marinifilum sp. D714]|uniref:histidinol-phosphatase HisJ family protein n=1 Tax=Marinifilum sp. D714 TaxID=2937523 RepID=UPI0027C91CF7|nr:histidinol-phosphatase HisJ family protein [Marinifilum sp. D714]MDQ2177909.1 histidinol-phosphatase HisJ family protein [Marinifilum sp. D714]
MINFTGLLIKMTQMPLNTTNSPEYFIWETHGIHVGTGNDHVKHGVDELEKITEMAIEKAHPNISFIIHTPRLTRFRYAAEERLGVKFIRGDNAYFHYPEKIDALKAKYGNQISIRYGIELEWLGPNLGMQWNRSKIFQAQSADFVIGSLHFSREGIPYDGSQEETDKLIEVRGGVENYWLGYIEELIEMIDTSWEMIQIVGHLDLPKLYAPIPKPLLELETSDHILARRMRFLLEMISEYNLALDVNLAGINKGCGIYPDMSILKRAKQLDIPIALGTDTHTTQNLGNHYQTGIEYAYEAGYKHYVSFSKSIPEKRPLRNSGFKEEKYKVMNLGIEMLNLRFEDRKQRRIPKFSFGGGYRTFLEHHKNATSLGDFEAIRIRKGDKSITISNSLPENTNQKIKGLYSHHEDNPGVLSMIFNALASEEINVETAYLNSNNDGTATAFLTLSGKEKSINEAVEFVKGTGGDNFFEIYVCDKFDIPDLQKGKNYLIEVDGVNLPIAISKQMILSIHNNSSGILLILLSALASRNINVNDLKLGQRGNKGYAILGIDGNSQLVSDVLKKLGPQFFETTHLQLTSEGI